jgi:hypothetical protein
MSAGTRVAALEAAIDAFVAGGCLHSYTADGVTVTRENLRELMDARDRLRREVAATKVRGVQFADLRGFG